MGRKTRKKSKLVGIPMHSTAWSDSDWRALAGAMGLPLPGGAQCPRLFPMAAATPKEAEKERSIGSGTRPPSMPVAAARTTTTTTSSQKPQPPQQPVAGLAAAKAAWASQRGPPTTRHRSSQPGSSAPPPSQQQQQQQAVAPPPHLPPPPPLPQQQQQQQQQQRRLSSCPLCGAPLPAEDPQAASAHVQACAAAAMQDDW